MSRKGPVASSKEKSPPRKQAEHQISTFPVQQLFIKPAARQRPETFPQRLLSINSNNRLTIYIHQISLAGHFQRVSIPRIFAEFLDSA